MSKRCDRRLCSASRNVNSNNVLTTGIWFRSGRTEWIALRMAWLAFVLCSGDGRCVKDLSGIAYPALCGNVCPRCDGWLVGAESDHE